MKHFLLTLLVSPLLSGCVSMGDWFQDTVKDAGKATVIPAATNAPAGQYVSAWALDPVAGNKVRDGGDEIVGFIGESDYRFLANDSKGKGYFMSGVVKRAVAFAWVKTPTGWQISAKDFTSDQTGLKYKRVGFRPQSSSAPMLTDNPLEVTDADMKQGDKKTFRTYWQTVK